MGEKIKTIVAGSGTIIILKVVKQRAATEGVCLWTLHCELPLYAPYVLYKHKSPRYSNVVFQQLSPQGGE